jgi:hypothetical protein
MTTEQENIIIQMFWDGLKDWDWETWCSTSSGDRESIVVDVLSDLGITTDIDEVYDLFYDWSSGLDESSFMD